METMTNGVMPVFDMADKRDDGMFGGSWIWVILLLLLFGGGAGFGFNRGQDLLASDEFIKRDIFNTNQNISNTACATQKEVLESRYTTQLGLQQLGAQQQACCCETQKEILQNRYDNALQTNTLQAQIAQCCCDLRAENLANTQKILDKMNQSEINSLRDQLNAVTNQLSQSAQSANLINTLRPMPMPAYITCSPYESAYNRMAACAYTNI